MAAVPPPHFLDRFLFQLADLMPAQTFLAHGNNLRALLALILVGLACGAVGSLVVGGRMAFFSDALAHVSFASVSIGFVVFTALLASWRPADEFWDWVTPIMLAFGMLVGYGIAAVRERTGPGLRHRHRRLLRLLARAGRHAAQRSCRAGGCSAWRTSSSATRCWCGPRTSSGSLVQIVAVAVVLA